MNALVERPRLVTLLSTIANVTRTRASIGGPEYQRVVPATDTLITLRAGAYDLMSCSASWPYEC